VKTRIFIISLLPALLAMLIFGSAGPVGAQTQQHIEKPGLGPSADPGLGSISPASFANGVNMPVTITGSNLDTVTSATLGTVALRNVEVTGSTEFSALVPWSIAPGTYDLTVRSQAGPDAVLPGAVTISAGATDWTSNGPYGGDLSNVVVDPVDPSRAYVSAGRSGLWKSQDGGAQWGFSLVTLFPNRTQIVYPTPGQPPVMYVGGDAGLGMVRSTDYGQTWVRKVPAEFNVLQSSGGVVVHPFLRPDQPNWVYVTFKSRQQDNEPLAGLYRSTDFGNTWSSVIGGTSGLNLTALAFDPAQPGLNMIMGTDSGQVYASADGGVTLGDPITFPHASYIGGLVFAPTLNASGHHTLWVITGDSNNEGTEYAYRSSDGGLTWTEVRVAPGSRNSGVTYHDSIPGLLWSAAGHGYYSDDDGDSWDPLGAGLDEAHGFAVVPGAASRQTTTLFAATVSGLYRSTNGGDTWQESDQGLGANLARTIVPSPFNADEAYAATQAKGLLHTFDGGRSWQSLPIPIGGNAAAIAPDPFVDGKVYIGDDPGSGWSLPPTVRVSGNHGSTFTEYSILLPPAHAGQTAAVAALAPDPQTPNRLLAGVCRLGDSGFGLIYASPDGGATWTPQETPPGITCITLLATDPQDPNVVYAGTAYSGLLRSADRGATWTLLANQPTEASSQSLAIDPSDSHSIYLSTYSGNGDDGVFATHDGGDTWVRMTGAKGGFVPTVKLVKVGADYWLYAATTSGLCFLRTIPDDPTTPWETASGMAGVAAAAGFNAATEDGRVVYYIGTSGGTVSSSASADHRLTTAAVSQNIPGGIYRSLVRIHQLYLPLVSR
jgi:photosystem II stability/assembly factor-like uncharacterized protein